MKLSAQVGCHRCLIFVIIWIFSNNVTPWGNRTLAEAKANPVGGDFYKLYTQNAINNVGRGTDWLGLVTRDGTIQQHNISVAGGNKATRFLLSGNYYDHKGVIKNSGFERYTVRGNIDQEINKFIKLGFNFSFSRINNNNSSLGSDQWENSGVIRAAIQQGPHQQMDLPAQNHFAWSTGEWESRHFGN